MTSKKYKQYKPFIDFSKFCLALLIFWAITNFFTPHGLIIFIAEFIIVAIAEFFAFYLCKFNIGNNTDILA